MPLATASPYLPDTFAKATAAPLPNHAVSLLSTRVAHLPARNKRVPAPHAPTLPPFVLVKRAPGLRHGCAVETRFRDALRSLPTSVLVKRVGVLSVLLQEFLQLRSSRASVPATHPLAQRHEGHWRAFCHSEMQGLGAWSAVTEMPCEAGQVVLVRSFSSHCRAPLIALNSRGAKAVLNGVGACRV